MTTWSCRRRRCSRSTPSCTGPPPSPGARWTPITAGWRSWCRSRCRARRRSTCRPGSAPPDCRRGSRSSAARTTSSAVCSSRTRTSRRPAGSPGIRRRSPASLEPRRAPWDDRVGGVMRDFGNKPGAGSAIADDDALGVPAIGKSTLTSALAPGGVPAVQRKDDASSANAAAVDAEVAGAQAGEATRPDEDWKPATGTSSTTLTGTFGDYTVEHGLTKAPDPTKSDGWGDYYLKITMTPNAKAGTSTILFVQVVRRGEISGGWHTKATDPFMGAERAKRTDP